MKARGLSSASAALLLLSACGGTGTAGRDARPMSASSAAQPSSRDAIVLDGEPVKGLSLDDATKLFPAAIARVHVAEPWLDVDAEYLAFDGSLAPLMQWQKAEIARRLPLLETHARGLARSEIVASNASVQSLRTSPVIVLASDHYVSLAFTVTEQGLWELGAMRSTRCVTIRRETGRLLGWEDYFRTGIIPWPELAGEQDGKSPCLVPRGLWLSAPALEMPVSGDDAPPTLVGRVIPMRALEGAVRPGVLPL